MSLFDARTPEEAMQLIAEGADVNERIRDRSTPLHRVRYPEIARVLIDAGADVNALNIYGQTPLHNAQNPEIVRLLLENFKYINYYTFV